MEILQNLLVIVKQIVMLLSEALMAIVYISCISLVTMCIVSYIADFVRKIIHKDE